MEQKIRNLIDYCQGIYHKENGKNLYDKYLADIESVTPQDIILIENEQLQLGLSPKDMLTFVDKLMNVFYKPLSKYQWNKPKEGDFLFYLMEENKALIHQLETFKLAIKQTDIRIDNKKPVAFLKSLKAYNEHLLKLENVLFPYLEKKMERFNGLKIMWSLHDDVRDQLKQMTVKLESKQLDETELNISLGQLYFNLYGLVKKQELILFPCATELLSKADFELMQKQSFDYAFAFIEKPKAPKPTATTATINYDALSKVFLTDTGHLNLEQLTFLLDALPIDLTYVDENDKVAYFSKPKERIFPRTAAVIGRDVRNCHPPESVHIVENILQSFRTGEKDEATFWIQLKGLFVHIQYVALRDGNGLYKGTLEITQEITHLRSLEGEKRLLDW
jgi:DUF438 domain-containing protein